MLLSIILPVYNNKETLSCSIMSVLNQTCGDWELIIVDDGSDDNSLEIAQYFSNKYERIKIYKNTENLGPAMARNIGMDKATGDYFGFLDSDDILVENYVEKMLETVASIEPDIVWCQYYEKNNSKDTEKIIENHIDKNRIFNNIEAISLFFYNIKGIGSLCNKIYSKEFIISNHLKLNKDRVRAEDWEFNLFAFSKVNKLILIEDFLYKYIQQNKDSIMHTFRLKDYEMMWQSMALLQTLNNKFKLNKTFKEIVSTRAIHFLEFVYGAILSFKLKNIRRILGDPRLIKILKEIDSNSLPPNYYILSLSLKHFFPTFTFYLFKFKNIIWRQEPNFFLKRKKKD